MIYLWKLFIAYAQEYPKSAYMIDWFTWTLIGLGLLFLLVSKSYDTYRSFKISKKETDNEV